MCFCTRAPRLFQKEKKLLALNWKKRIAKLQPLLYRRKISPRSLLHWTMMPLDPTNTERCTTRQACAWNRVRTFTYEPWIWITTDTHDSIITREATELASEKFPARKNRLSVSTAKASSRKIKYWVLARRLSMSSKIKLFPLQIYESVSNCWSTTAKMSEFQRWALVISW